MAIEQLVFVDNNPPQCDAAFLNSVRSEVNNIISSSGITLNDGDQTQLSLAVASYVANASAYTDSGVADSYVLNPISNGSGTNSSPQSYLNDMIVRFRPGNTNTGASTINVNSLGVKDIKKEDGTTDVNAGDIIADQYITLIYDGVVFRTVSIPIPLATVSQPGIVQKATQADVEGEVADRYADAESLKFIPGAAKAWGYFDGTAVTPAFFLDYNFGTITDNGLGDFTCAFTNSLANANYSVGGSVFDTTVLAHVLAVFARAVGSVRIRTYDNNSEALQNCDDTNVIVFGDL